MHSRATVAEALRLRDEQRLGATEVAQRLGISRGAVRDCYAGRLPRHSRRESVDGRPIPPACPVCNHDEHPFAELPREYVYLLGLYRGDGTISAHRRDVYRLRIFLDLRYPRIIDECEAAMSKVMPANSVNRLERGGRYATGSEPSNVEVSSFSKSWPCLFPQHGPGMKHTRRIWLAEWQPELAERWPEAPSRKAGVALMDEFIGPKA